MMIITTTTTIIIGNKETNMSEINHQLAHALAEFTKFVIDKYDTDDPSARTQLFVRGVFGGASCGSLVKYAKIKQSLANKYLSQEEIKAIENRI